MRAIMSPSRRGGKSLQKTESDYEQDFFFLQIGQPKDSCLNAAVNVRHLISAVMRDLFIGASFDVN